MRPMRAVPTAVVLLLVSFATVYAGVVAALVRDWAIDDNASHGFLILPVVGWVVWQQRRALAALPQRPHAAGLLITVASLTLLVAGTLGAERFVTRVSMVAAAAGVLVFLFGWAHLRALAFPFSFALLMIPPPAIVFNHVALRLQLIASQLGTAGLRMLDVPVLREGNIIVLSNTTLEVAEACSGIRSLASLMAFGIMYGYLADRRRWVRVAIALAAIPTGIIANGIRVAGTGIAAYHYGAAAADGFLHAFSGWLLFVVAIVPVVIAGRLLCALPPRMRAAEGL